MIERIGDKSVFTYIGLEKAMAKYKPYDYSQRVMIPVSLEEQLVPGILEFAIQTLVEDRMDMSVFEDRYQNDETGRMAYCNVPKLLLKVVLLGYARGLIFSRKMEQACRENVTFMALACGQRPDHSTIAAFVSSMQDEIVPLFRDVLLVCEESGLLGGTFFALDGCKLPSNASKAWSGKISDLVRKKKKMEKRVTELLKRQVEVDKKDEEGGKDIFSGLNRPKQIERLKRKAERIRQFLKGNGEKMGRTGKEIKGNVTDNESANMMTSHGVVQGYNGQTMVDGKFQVIVHGEAFGEGQDHYYVAPMVEGAKENLQAIGHPEDCLEDKVWVANSNYSSPANLEACREEKLDVYIPDKNFRTRDPRFATQERWKSQRTKRFDLEDFRYEEEADEYICPHGKGLRLRARKAINDGVIYKRYVANREDCKGCELKGRCIRGKVARRRILGVPLGAVPGNLLKDMVKKVDTERGREIYHQRIGIVEPVFANIRAVKRLDRFTLRGKIKVNIQWVLYCMVHNIGKIMSYGFA